MDVCSKIDSDIDCSITASAGDFWAFIHTIPWLFEKKSASFSLTPAPNIRSPGAWNSTLSTPASTLLTEKWKTITQYCYYYTSKVYVLQLECSIQWSPDNSYKKIVRITQNVWIIDTSESMGKHTIVRMTIVPIIQGSHYSASTVHVYDIGLPDKHKIIFLSYMYTLEQFGLGSMMLCRSMIFSSSSFENI